MPECNIIWSGAGYCNCNIHAPSRGGIHYSALVNGDYL